MTQILVPRIRTAIACSSCGAPVLAPGGAGGPVDCGECGNRMTVVNLKPAGETSRATSGG